MGDKTGIAWTDATWNCIVGCTHASRGCDFCYARTLHDRRFLAWKRGRFADAPEQYRKPFKQVQLLPERLEIPLYWKKPRRVFVNSVSDLFHEDVPFTFVAEVFGVMAASPQHTFQVLTKRPERMVEFFKFVDLAAGTAQREVFRDDDLDWCQWHIVRAAAVRRLDSGKLRNIYQGWPLSNVWLGTSAEDQDAADLRIGELLKTPAAVHFISYEPALGPVDFTRVKWPGKGEHRVDVLRGGFWHDQWGFINHRDFPARVAWVICGGESGPKHRPFDLDWARQARDQCVAAGVPFFFKQVGGLTPKSGGDLLDGRVWHQFPEAPRG